MRIAYFDCFAGAGGDMIVGAMLGAGLDADYLKEQIATLGLADVSLDIFNEMRSGISGVRFIPTVGHGKHSRPADAPSEEHHHHEHKHKHGHGHHHHHEHHHRNIVDIRAIINGSGISDKAKADAIGIFEVLGKAEAKVHGKGIEEVHFHEVGAVDSIVDIVSAAVGLDALGIDRVCCSRLSVGSGTVKCAHGILPVPAPATAEILADAGADIWAGPGDFEMLTPTAAAVFSYYADSYGPMPGMRIEAIGNGAGGKEAGDFANLLRLVIGASDDAGGVDVDSVCLIEANVDDATAENIGFVAEALMSAGALDVYTTAIQMKQNRPGVKISVIAQHEDVGKLEGVIFEQGLSIGVRKQTMERAKLARRIVGVDTAYGRIDVKVAEFGGRQVSVKAEYQQCLAAAKAHGKAIKQVQDEVVRAYQSGAISG